MFPDAPRVGVDSPLRGRSRSRSRSQERSREKRKLKRRRWSSGSDSDSSHSSTERHPKLRHRKREEPRRKVLKPNGNNIPRSSRTGGNDEHYRRGSYWLHDDRDYDKRSSVHVQENKTMQKKLTKKTSTEKRTSHREVLMPSKLQEKKDQKRDMEGKQSPHREGDKLEKESGDEKGLA